jgi:hypothetical protein
MDLAVVVKPVATKYSFESSVLPYWVGSFGLLLTLFAAYYLAATQNRARVIELTVAERTAALSDANISLHNEILERQRAEMEMRRAKDQAEVANRAKSEFLAMVSHELRTPLNAIIGFSETMSQEVFGPVGNKKYKGYVGDIRKSGTHLLGLINNILDLSKVESGQFGLSEQEVNLGDGISEILRLVSELAEAGDVKVDSTVPEDLPELRGDRQAIRQITRLSSPNRMGVSRSTPGSTIPASWYSPSWIQASAYRKRPWTAYLSALPRLTVRSPASSRGPGWDCRLPAASLNSMTARSNWKVRPARARK